MPVLVIYNPVSGDRSAKALFDGHVLPLLAKHNVTPDKVVATESSGHVGNIVADFLLSSDHSQPISVVLGSGDGTLHELINVLNNTPSSKPFPRIHLALVPCGTANALYASLFPPSPDEDPVEYKLKSVKAFVSGDHHHDLCKSSSPMRHALTIARMLHHSISDERGNVATLTDLMRFRKSGLPAKAAVYRVRTGSPAERNAFTWRIASSPSACTRTAATLVVAYSQDTSDACPRTPVAPIR
ncbi:hypothetical protein NUW54_g13334 [Trametes sanguinea]|uniref:Uncharacterized protein n=1 Tax=Trametes sanguinea TaxID=158606 RepID=A0ACC1MNC4_9APHY|nr:hypothetical protein NUW54_g13334 [Trametes sanguinea]